MSSEASRVGVSLGIDCDGCNFHAFCGPHDPARDLASISDQDAIKHLTVLLEGDVAVFTDGLVFVLRAKKLERTNQVRPRRVRFDHIIYEATSGGFIGVIEGVLVLLSTLRLLLLRIISGSDVSTPGIPEGERG